jgi:molecular chaperone GrpE
VTDVPHPGDADEVSDGREPAGSRPEATATDAAPRRHHSYYEGGPGASAEPGGEDEYDHGPGESEGEALAQEDALAATYLADLQRLQAEYVNYKRRVDRDRELIRTTAVGSVVEALLPVLDDIHMARQAGDLVEGPFAAISDKLESILGKYGVERLGEAGQEFDPTVHEALMHVEAELPEGASGTTVVQVIQPGYRIGERVVRAARVSVADPA